MKKILFIILWLSQAIYASDQIQVSILTCSPGQNVYSLFGHTSIRVKNRQNNTDEVYNFGMFNFNTPNFEYKYLKGKLEYYLAIQKTESFIENYTSKKRLVSEQVLDLSNDQKSKLLKRLQFLYQPENRFYLYSFLDKNCSTAARDLLVHIGVDFQNKELGYSNRDLINSYLTKMPWLRLGINMVLGKSLDKNSTRQQSVFLPDYLRKEVDNAMLNGHQLVKFERNLNTIVIKDEPVNSRWFLSPLMIFSVLALLSVFWAPKPLQVVICLAIGLIGSLLLALWLFSDHEEVKFNLNIIWCNPLYLVYVWSIIRNKGSKIISKILLGTILLSLLIWIFKIQIFDIGTLPILAILSIFQIKTLKKQKEYPLSPK